MKRRIVEIKMIFLVVVFGFIGCTEHQKAEHRGRKNFPFEANIKKDTLYFLWENYQEYNGYTNKIETVKPYRSDNEQSLAFGYPNGEYFLFEEGFISERLKIKNLKNYKISSINDLDSINKEWHRKNPTFSPQKYNQKGEPLPLLFNRTLGYVVYIIVISEDKKYFTIYPVIWQGKDYSQ